MHQLHLLELLRCMADPQLALLILPLSQLNGFLKSLQVLKEFNLRGMFNKG